jgi:hypothetical protein
MTSFATVSKIPLVMGAETLRSGMAIIYWADSAPEEVSEIFALSLLREPFVESEELNGRKDIQRGRLLREPSAIDQEDSDDEEQGNIRVCQL